jgi:hypothetical protein
VATRLVLLPYLQRWDTVGLDVQLLVVPRGSPLDALIGGAPSFAEAKFVFDVHVVPGLDAMPVLGGAPTTTITSAAVATALPIFTTLSTQYTIDPSPPPPVTRPPGTLVKKHLPTTYQNAVGYAPGRTPLVFTDDTYRCALSKPPPSPVTIIQDPGPKIPWGKVIAILLRNPALAAAAGLVRTLRIPIAPATALSGGGWLYVTLSTTSDAAGLLGVSDGLKIYTARIPLLSAARDIFTPVLFPVTTTPPTADYGALYAEVDDYDDGWAKVVHCVQPQQLDPLQETPDGTRPVREIGMRLGWDDEQVTIWMSRQIDANAADLDAPLGVHGYRIDARLEGGSTWHSLVHAHGPMKVGAVDLGTFDGELAAQVHPVQLDAQMTGDYWLSTYFAAWMGRTLVSSDTDQLQLIGGPDRSGIPGVIGTPPTIALRYGKTYQFRVRFMDHTGGGPAVTDSPVIPGPQPVATIPFRRWIRPLSPTLIDPPPATPDPLHPPASLEIARPLLQYPAVLCTGAYPNAVADLKADIPTAKARGREPGLPDPDINRVLITVEAQGLTQDPAADDGGYMSLYQTTRPFPRSPGAALTLSLAWTDVHDATTIATPARGPLLLPTARNVRLKIAALGRDDPTHAYFGADDVRVGPAVTVDVRKNSTDERALFAPDLPTHRFSAYFLQPDPVVDITVQFAQRAAGNPGQRPADIATRLATALGLANNGLTLRALPGRRIVFGCGAGLRHVIGPDLASITFAARGELARHWIVALRLTLDRDWTWDALESDGIVVTRNGVEISRFGPNRSVGAEALDHPTRAQTDVVFLDAVDPQVPTGQFPQELNLTYGVSTNFKGAPQTDAPLTLAIRLPVTSAPTQVPTIVSAGIAMSPYLRSDDYSSTAVRERALWVELDAPPADPRDQYFARVLRMAPDPLISTLGVNAPDAPEPPLAIDPELVRVIVQNQSDDQAGLNAMQPLIPSDSPIHFLLPLPAGIDESSPECFGFFTYELRVGHVGVWSTAQGRFGAPLRVAGVQHPAPVLACTVVRTNAGILVSAPFAIPVLDGQALQTVPPRSRMWVLLYVQAEQLDRADRRNVLIGRAPAVWQRNTFGGAPASYAWGDAAFADAEVRMSLEALGFDHDASLSVLAVELLPQDVPPKDPLGADLGQQRILRTSTLTPVPAIC